ncbi:MAG TPA: DUF202 domain-containing protein [Fimbriiglobus sp.]|jgi:uncharacterized membrane protein YidH (DUF202 family)
MTVDDLARRRTELALERTQLAWVRTAFTLITAGIAFDKGGRALYEARLMQSRNWYEGGHILGVGLSALSAGFLTWTLGVFVVRSRELTAGRLGLAPVQILSAFVSLLGFSVAVLLLVWG